MYMYILDPEFPITLLKHETANHTCETIVVNASLSCGTVAFIHIDLYLTGTAFPVLAYRKLVRSPKVSRIRVGIFKCPDNFYR